MILFNLIIVTALLSCVAAQLMGSSNSSNVMQDQIAQIEALTQSHLDAVKNPFMHVIEREDFETEEDYLLANKVVGSADSFRVHVDEIIGTSAITSYIAYKTYMDTKCSSLYMTTSLFPLDTCLNSYSNGVVTGSAIYSVASASLIGFEVNYVGYSKAGCTGSTASGTSSFSTACGKNYNYNYMKYVVVNSAITTTDSGYYISVYYDSNTCTNAYGFSKYSSECIVYSSTSSLKYTCGSSTKVSKVSY